MYKRKLDKKLLDIAIKRGLRAVEIGKLYGCNTRTVVRACDAYGLHRPRCNTRAVFSKDALVHALKQGLTAKDIAAKFKCSRSAVWRSHRRFKITTPIKATPPSRARKHTFNTRFFNRIDNAAKAYVIGFIAADGGLDRNWGVKIAIHIRDIDIVNMIAAKMRCNYTPRVIENGTRVCLSLYDVDMVRDLAKYGIVNRKTYTLPFAKNIPKKYIHAYLRGVFDGDGSIGKSVRLVTGSKLFYTAFLKWYLNYYSVAPWTACEGGTKWRIVFWKKHARFIHDMYRGAKIVSSRRKRAYLEFWSNNDMARSRK